MLRQNLVQIFHSDVEATKHTPDMHIFRFYIMMVALYATASANLHWNFGPLYIPVQIPSGSVITKIGQLVDYEPFAFEIAPIAENCAKIVSLVFEERTEPLQSSYNFTININQSAISHVGFLSCHITAENLNTSKSDTLNLVLDVRSQNCNYDPTKCSNKSVCNSTTGNCDCQPNYYSFDCSKYCNANLTCFGRGKCSYYGNCVCDRGSNGPDCGCSDTKTCFGNGKCTMLGTCECIKGYWGQNCDKKCECKHGECDIFGRCTCQKDFFGQNCEFSCYSDCITHGGQCSADNTCICPDLRFGVNCETNLTWLVIIACIIFAGAIVFGAYWIHVRKIRSIRATYTTIE